MSITAITIQHFKGIAGPVRVELRPVTLLFGPNSAGKSTVLQALHYAREVFERANLDPDQTAVGGSMDLGGFQRLVHQRVLEHPIRLTLECQTTQEDFPDYSFYPTDAFDEDGYEQLEGSFKGGHDAVDTLKVELTVHWSEHLQRPVVTGYGLAVNGKDLATIKATRDGRQVTLTGINRLHPFQLDLQDLIDVYGDTEQLKQALARVDEDLEDSRYQEQAPPPNILDQESALPPFDRPVRIQTGKGELINPDLFAHLLAASRHILRNKLAKLLYVGPIREVPPRTFSPQKSPAPARWAAGLAAWDALHADEGNLVERANYWLASDKRLDSGYRLRLNRYRRLASDSRLTRAMVQGLSLDDLQDDINELLKQTEQRELVLLEESGQLEVQPQDIGVGISQVLPVVVAALATREGIVAVEQPELHIHPAFQVALGDLFIEESQDRDVTFLLETHSEHLLLRFLRRIRQAADNELPPDAMALQPDDLAVYHVEHTETGTIFTRIRVDEDGEFIDHWPNGFFEERAEELFR